uniref:Uncharacterized protein n=1 Tax=Cacopsylla melanoneura TaxID=428564 RepID=A0A8D8WWX2_9HEMI
MRILPDYYQSVLDKQLPHMANLLKRKREMENKTCTIMDQDSNEIEDPTVDEYHNKVFKITTSPSTVTTPRPKDDYYDDYVYRTTPNSTRNIHHNLTAKQSSLAMTTRKFSYKQTTQKRKSKQTRNKAEKELGNTTTTDKSSEEIKEIMNRPDIHEIIDNTTDAVLQTTDSPEEFNPDITVDEYHDELFNKNRTTSMPACQRRKAERAAALNRTMKKGPLQEDLPGSSHKAQDVDARFHNQQTTNKTEKTPLATKKLKKRKRRTKKISLKDTTQEALGQTTTQKLSGSSKKTKKPRQRRKRRTTTTIKAE